MRILFVLSGYSIKKASPVVLNQAKSLTDQGLEISYFFIKGKGVKGYIKAAFRLKKHLKKNNYDIIHAHYSLCGFSAAIAGAKPLIVSLMGSDVSGGILQKFLLKIFIRKIWAKTIVKTQEMAQIVGIKHVQVIPNGVNLDLFFPIEKNEAKNKAQLDVNKKYILFAANPNRAEKNFKLANNAFNTIKNKEYNLIYLENISHKNIPALMNSVDVVILSSFREGSPNVIKEAMACNKPIVSTEVGDVSWLIENCNGCFISSNKLAEYANNLQQAITYSEKYGTTKGREKLKSLSLDSQHVAKKIITLYQSII